MEVPAKLRSVLAGFRYWLLALVFMTTSTFLVSCGGGETTVTITDPNVPVVTNIGKIILTIDLNDPLVANGIDTTVVTAEVDNLDGTPAQDGTIVTFSVAPIGSIPAYAATIDGAAIVKLTSGTVAGGYYLTATTGDVSQIAYGEIVAGLAADANTGLTANPDQMPADGISQSEITLSAADLFGNPVADGTTVDFYSTRGTLSAATGTTANGIATVTLTSTSNPGDQSTVTARIAGFVKNATVGFGVITGGGTGAAAYIELDVTTDVIKVKGSGGTEAAVITATVKDETGAAILDCPGNITFEIAAGPNGGEALDGLAIPVTKSTSNGVASVTITSGTVSGTVRVKAEVIQVDDGGCTGVGSPFATAYTTSIAIEAGEPVNVIIFQDNLVEANENDGSISQTFSALVQDLHGNPVENGTVVYFGLVDNPDSAGPPYLGYISAGINGVTNGTTTFASAGSTFLTDGLMNDNILIILEGQDQGGHRIASVDNNTGLTLYNTMNGSETGLNFVAGSAELGTICGSVQTGNLEMDPSCTPTMVGGVGSIKGVAHTKLTWVPQAIFKPFHMYAESVGGDVGDTLADSYGAVPAVTVTVIIVPSSVVSGTIGIFVEAEIRDKDGAGNPIQGQEVVFSSSNAGVASISGANPVVTGANGKAATAIDTTDCLAEDADLTITAALGSFVDTASLSVSATAPTAEFTCTDAGDGNHANCVDDSTTPAGTTITSWSWNIDCDGTNESSLQNPTLALGPGTTQVCLTVKNNAEGSCASQVAEAVVIEVPAP